jgi:hypothetical protein
MMPASGAVTPIDEPATDGPRAAAWTEDRIRRELRRFMAGRTEWPPYREFQRAGLKALRDNLTRQGGARRWAEEIGVSYVKHRPGYATVWTQERIREDLRAYLAGRKEWPSRERFERDGHTALRNAINRTGGPDRWATEFGLPRPNRLSGIRRGWTPELVEQQLRKLIGDGATWPSRREFDAAGLRPMLCSIYAHEGLEYWATRMGVALRPGLARPAQRFWTMDRIREELERFCAGRVVWPTEREFVHAGQRPLYGAASRNGGVAWWADLLGLARRR